MASGTLFTTDAEIDAALNAAQLEESLPTASNVRFLRDTRLLLLSLNSGQRIAIPVEDLEDIQGATDDHLSEPQILGPGTAIYFPQSGHSVYVPYLAAGQYGSERWMQQLASRTAKAA